MSFQFSIEEIFELAEQIERNGAKFYGKAAGQVTDQNYKLLLLDLVDMEEKHERVFAYLKEKIVDQKLGQGLLDPDASAVQYLRSFADGVVFDLNADPSEFLSTKRSLEEILRYAIGLEKDSIVFYYGIQALVPEELGKSQINTIIREEMKHITFLNDKLKALGKL
ncbi:ferritin family protein [bacterium]|nr:ferritin family protein [bacterium]